MERVIELTIKGEPIAKQSVQFGKGNAYHPAKIMNMKADIERQLSVLIDKASGLWRGKPIKATITYIFEPPKSTSKKVWDKIDSGETFYKITKPDLGDNLNKLILDVMEGYVYDNDSEICVFQLEKVYGSDPRTEISLELIETNNYFRKRNKTK